MIWEGAKNVNKPAVRGSAGFLTFNESNFVRPDKHAGFQQKQKKKNLKSFLILLLRH